MYKCKYCEIKMEEELDICPNCGSVEFLRCEKSNIKVIDNKNKYIVNYQSRTSEIMACLFVLLIAAGLITGAFFLFRWLNHSLQTIDTIKVGFSVSDEVIKDMFMSMSGFVMLSVSLYFVAASCTTIVRALKEKANIKYLTKNGILVKNLPYLEVSKNPIDYTIMSHYVEVLYTMNNKNLILKGMIKTMILDKGTVDLLIDPNNPNIYFIDSEIGSGDTNVQM